jgi:eukaryotic translation initiation factor 2C
VFLKANLSKFLNLNSSRSKARSCYFWESRNLTTYSDACVELKINPKITIIVVAKRHHVRFFPSGSGPGEQDKSGNCLAGTVVDQVVAHPTEFDWYLQSHGGLLGTSRPAHYNVLYDENDFR